VVQVPEYLEEGEIIKVDTRTGSYLSRAKVESEYLKRTAELFLNNQENVLSCAQGDNKYMTWTGMFKVPDDMQTDKEIPYACFVNTAKNWQRVSAALDSILKPSFGISVSYVMLCVKTHKEGSRGVIRHARRTKPT
jgi:hypothetical protein